MLQHNGALHHNGGDGMNATILLYYIASFLGVVLSLISAHQLHIPLSLISAFVSVACIYFADMVQYLLRNEQIKAELRGQGRAG